MTAAWQNLETVNTGTPPKSIDPRDNEPLSMPEKAESRNVVLSVTLYHDRLELGENNEVRVFRNLNGALDIAQLKPMLSVWRKRYPGKKDVILSTENRAPYKHLILLMDRLIEAGFPEVGITLN